MVKTGIDRIGEAGVSRLLENKKLGVISAASAVSSDYRYTIDILNEKYDVAAIFSPEHGPRGVFGPGEKVGGGVDRVSGLPVYSLFGDLISFNEKSIRDGEYMPCRDVLSRLDCLVFDMQDVGSRYFTYVSTLFYVMRACADAALPLIVLDRPDPIGGDVEGCVQEPENLSFIGLTRVPIRHGMTVGELARLYNGEYGLGCDLTVVTLTGWDHGMYYDDTGLPFVRPSPNLPTLESILVYNGTCMFAGTNVSEGRGTTQPFLLAGAEYIDPVRYADELNSKGLDGIRFSPAFFRPEYSKHAGKTLYGVRLHVTDKRALRPVTLGVTMIRTVQELYPDDFEFTKPKTDTGRYHIDLSTGNSDLRLSGLTADEIIKKWDKDAKAFLPVREKYLLYD
ncbi:MAG: DUF1343 domain-containing protein [Clostridia bacterium]|nr:DUF1343 domain-containing protein [Clostridia bacterium]